MKLKLDGGEEAAEVTTCRGGECAVCCNGDEALVANAEVISDGE